MMKKNRLRLAALALVLLLCAALSAVPALGEGESWVCPSCGMIVIQEHGEACPVCGLRMPVATPEPAGTEDAAPSPEPPAARPEKTALQAGDFVTFGRYPQTAEGTDETPIEWLVLEVDEENHKALLISKYGLDAKPYHSRYTNVSWKNCTLREWLNEEFLNKAFSEVERQAVLRMKIDNGKNQAYQGRWTTDGGPETTDQLFLLSYAEVNRFFHISYSEKNSQLQLKPTAYAVRQGAKTNRFYNGAGEWWLRSTSTYEQVEGLVYINGVWINSFFSIEDICVYSDGLTRNDVTDASVLVRPALWVNLNAIVD